MNTSLFQFSNPALSKLSFSINPEFSLSQDDQVGMRTKIKTEIVRSQKDPTATVALNLSLNESSDKAPFVLHATIQASFRWDKSLESNIVDSLLSKNAPALLLSYLRPVIAFVTNSSPYPAYNLPFINFNDSDNDKAESISARD